MFPARFQGKNARIDFALQDKAMSHSSATDMNQTYGVQSAAQSFSNLEAFENFFPTSISLPEVCIISTIRRKGQSLSAGEPSKDDAYCI